jgi:hypothetical protein
MQCAEAGTGAPEASHPAGGLAQATARTNDSLFVFIFVFTGCARNPACARLNAARPAWPCRQHGLTCHHLAPPLHAHFGGL